jgi:hypothetical protein
MNINTCRLSLEFADLVHEGYSQYSFYGDEGEWTKDNWIELQDVYFWCLDCLCVPRNSDLRLRFIFEMRDILSASHIGVYGTLAKALVRFWWKRIRVDVKKNCKRCVVCR